MSITIRELAALSGVSVATVSLVLSDKAAGRVGAARREQIRHLAKRLGYRHNLAARGLSEGRTYRLALAIEGPLSGHAIIGNFSLHDRLGLLAGAIHRLGYALELLQVETARPLPEVCRAVTAATVDGFIFLAWPAKTLRLILPQLDHASLPAAACGTTLAGLPTIWTDVDRAASFSAATRLLLDTGHRRIVLLDCDPSKRHSPPKRRAFLRTIKGGGSAVHGTVVVPRQSSYEAVFEATRHAVGDAPTTALLLTDNFYADAVLHALRSEGRVPGKDCRVIGFGDTALADCCSPQVSHYSLQVAEQAAFCLDALLESIGTPTAASRHRLFPPLFVPRET